MNENTCMLILGIIVILSIITFITMVSRQFYLIYQEDKLMDAIEDDVRTLETLTGVEKDELDKVIDQKMEALIDFRTKHKFFL